MLSLKKINKRLAAPNKAEQYGSRTVMRQHQQSPCDASIDMEWKPALQHSYAKVKTTYRVNSSMVYAQVRALGGCCWRSPRE